MARSTTWMPLYIGDYLADTARLTVAQHGAYLLLIMDYWRNGPPPDDDATLARIIGATGAEWRKLRPAIVGFFSVIDGRWHHKRIDAERQKATDEYKRQCDRAANARAKAKADVSPDVRANARVESQSQSQSHSPDGELIADERAGARDPGAEACEAAGIDLAKRPDWFAKARRVEAWINSGFDLDADILPTIKAVMANRNGAGSPGSLNYFDRAIADAHATRTKPPPEGKPQARASPALPTREQIRRAMGYPDEPDPKAAAP